MIIIQDTRTTIEGEYTPPSAAFVVDCEAVWVVVENCSDGDGATATLQKLRVDGQWEDIQTLSITNNYLVQIDGVYRIGSVAPCRCVIVKTEVQAGSCSKTTGDCDCADGFSPYVSDGLDGFTEGNWIDALGDTGIAAQGVQGIRGATGPMGGQGIQGPQGLQGTQGTQGVDGVQGIDGDTGPAGTDGTDGSGVIILGSDTIENILNIVDANIGDMWITTNDGLDGNGDAVLDGDGIIWDGNAWRGVGPIQGPKGDTGSTGVQGVQGVQGIAGDTGGDGGLGPQGPAGAAGATGDQGPMGLQGNTGISGPTGLPGIQGAQGVQGIQGPLGSQGVVGSTGQAGTDGSGVIILGSDTIENILGIAGANIGDMWITTNDGLDGNGDSVLDGDGIIWDGSAWRGVGPIQGPLGPLGPQGVQGDAGIQGPQGIQGQQGTIGPQGSPGEDCDCDDDDDDEDHDDDQDTVTHAAMRLQGEVTKGYPVTPWTKLDIFDEIVMSRVGAVADPVADTITLNKTGYYQVSVAVNVEMASSQELYLTLFRDGVEYSIHNFAVHGIGAGKPIELTWTSNINVATVPHVFDVRAQTGDGAGNTVRFLRATFKAERNGNVYVPPP